MALPYPTMGGMLGGYVSDMNGTYHKTRTVLSRAFPVDRWTSVCGWPMEHAAVYCMLTMTESSLSGTSKASETQIRVVVAAVRDLIRHGLETVLSQLPGVTVTATTASTATTIEAVVEHSPDILIIRTNPLQLDAADVAQRLKSMARSVPLLILTTSLDFPEASVAQARQALHAWGSGRVSCVSMDAPVEVLQSALSLMALGYSVLGRKRKQCSYRRAALPTRSPPWSRRCFQTRTEMFCDTSLKEEPTRKSPRS